MSDKNVNVDLVQDTFSAPFRVKMVGGRTIFIAAATVLMCLTLMSIHDELQRSNELRKAQLEQARRQYTLDSLKHEHFRTICPIQKTK